MRELKTTRGTIDTDGINRRRMMANIDEGALRFPSIREQSDLAVSARTERHSGGGKSSIVASA